MERVRLDQHDLQIQLAEQLAQNGPLVVLACGIAGLADRHAKGGGVECLLGDEC